MFELFIGVVLIALIISTFVDLKTFEIPDAITHFLILFGIGAHVLLSLNDAFLISNLFISLGIATIFGLIMYYTGQWGGGDTKLLIGISAMLPSYILNAPYPFIVSFIVNLMIAGGIYSTLFLIHKSVINSKKIDSDLPFMKYMLILSVFFIFGKIYILGASLMILMILILAIHVQNKFFVKKIGVNSLVEGDWVLDEIKYRGKFIFRPKKTGVSKKDILIIQKYCKKPLNIKTGVAFGPAFLIAFLLTLKYGDLIFTLLSEYLSKI
jgi:prepilin signal peptidase PulO-like enzyme (type II secretory pathway)